VKVDVDRLPVAKIWNHLLPCLKQKLPIGWRMPRIRWLRFVETSRQTIKKRKYQLNPQKRVFVTQRLVYPRAKSVSQCIAQKASSASHVQPQTRLAKAQRRQLQSFPYLLPLDMTLRHYRQSEIYWATMLMLTTLACY
jgi:hypothetical protein